MSAVQMSGIEIENPSTEGIEIAPALSEPTSTIESPKLPPNQYKMSDVDSHIVRASVAKSLKIDPDKIGEYDYNPRHPDGRLNVDGLRISLRSLGAKDETVEDLMSYLRATVGKLEGSRAFRMDREPISWRAFNSALAKHTRWDSGEVREKYSEPLIKFVAELTEEFQEKQELTLRLRALKFELKAREGEEGKPYSKKSAHPFSKTILNVFEKAVCELSYPGEKLSEETIKSLSDLKTLMRQDGEALKAVGGRPLTIDESKAFHAMLASIRRINLRSAVAPTGEMPNVTPSVPPPDPADQNIAIVQIDNPNGGTAVLPAPSEPLDLYGEPLRDSGTETKDLTDLEATVEHRTGGQQEFDFDIAAISPVADLAPTMPVERTKIVEEAVVTPSNSESELDASIESTPSPRPSWFTRVRDRLGSFASGIATWIIEIGASLKGKVATFASSRHEAEERALIEARLDKYIPQPDKRDRSQVASPDDHNYAIRQALLNDLVKDIPRGIGIVPRGERLIPEKLQPEQLRDGDDVWVCDYPADNVAVSIGRYSLKAARNAALGFLLERNDGKPPRELSPDTITKLKRLRHDRSEMLDAISQLQPHQGWQLQFVVPQGNVSEVREVLQDLSDRKLINSVESAAPVTASAEDRETHTEFTIGVGDGARLRRIADYLSQPQVLGELFETRQEFSSRWYSARDGLHLSAGIVARFFDDDLEFDSGHYMGIPLPTVSVSGQAEGDMRAREARRAVAAKGKQYGPFFFAALIGDEICREAGLLEGVKEARAYILSLVPKDEASGEIVTVPLRTQPGVG